MFDGSSARARFPLHADNVPDELRRIPQWLVWVAVDKPDGGITKLPVCPHSLEVCNAHDATKWATFDQVTAQYETTGWLAGIAFVLTANDPYTVVDLDDVKGDAALYQEQLQLFQTFQSYTEVSPSNKGAHIWAKGKIKSRQWQEKCIGVYADVRFMTVTGNIVPGSVRGIHDRQSLLASLVAEFPSAKRDAQGVGDFDGAEHVDDAALLDRAANARNGALFIKLWSGDWSGSYPSQSEADQALMNLIAFYTDSREQAIRVFRMSELGTREKAQRMAYMATTVGRAFDQKMTGPAPFDLTHTLARIDTPVGNVVGIGDDWPVEDDDETALSVATASAVTVGLSPVTRSETARDLGDHHTTDSLAGADATVPTVQVSRAVVDKAVCPYARPPGLMGEIADYVMQQSPKPVADFAYAAAIGFMAALCGRAYNTYSNTGLNLFILVTANTGRGKESMVEGINRIVSAVSKQQPTVRNFIGRRAASSQGLLKMLEEHPSHLTTIGEYGKVVRDRIKPGSGNAVGSALIGTELDLYNKSGHGQFVGSQVYSEKDKNTKGVTAPAYSILAETAPGSFYEYISEANAEDGFLPRFIVFDYKGESKQREQDTNARVPVELIRKLEELVQFVNGANQRDEVIKVPADAEARAILKAVESQQITYQNAVDSNGNDTIEGLLWNRAELNTLRLASLIAVGVDMHAPRITGPIARMAADTVTHCLERLLHRYHSGGFGSQVSDVGRMKALQNAIMAFGASGASYDVPSYAIERGYMPHRYFQQRLHNISCFRNASIGEIRAVALTLDEAVKMEMLTRCVCTDVDRANGVRSDYYKTNKLVDWSAGEQKKTRRS